MHNDNASFLVVLFLQANMDKLAWSAEHRRVGGNVILLLFGSLTMSQRFG